MDDKTREILERLPELDLAVAETVRLVATKLRKREFGHVELKLKIRDVGIPEYDLTERTYRKM